MEILPTYLEIIPEDTGVFFEFYINNDHVGKARYMNLGKTLIDFRIYSSFRSKGYSSLFLDAILSSNFSPKRLFAEPFQYFPDKEGLTTEQLVEFYKRHGFKIINITSPLGILMKI